MNASWAHTGSLLPLNSIGSSASYFAAATKPTLFGVNNIYGKAMTVYENGDDFGFNDTYASQWYGSACREIACCNIRKWKIVWPQEYTIEVNEDKSGRNLKDLEEDIDYFSPDEFRELFGVEPDQEDPFF